MGIARSEGGILGPWRQEQEPFVGRDGGPGMVFRTFDLKNSTKGVTLLGSIFFVQQRRVGFFYIFSII